MMDVTYYYISRYLTDFYETQYKHHAFEMPPFLTIFNRLSTAVGVGLTTPPWKKLVSKSEKA
jgi:hypothetical protein